ncbi:hypothetical protein Sjap_019655 [Stephania japonica]|uniref:SAM domain-containing protein n=1 Tax=Stephania japonica TaxID=461633 RepID=A0AAP0F0J6_9MAGN
MFDEDDDFQNPISLTQNHTNPLRSRNPSSQPLKPSNRLSRSSKKTKRSVSVGPGKENAAATVAPSAGYSRGSSNSTASSKLVEKERSCLSLSLVSDSILQDSRDCSEENGVELDSAESQALTANSNEDCKLPLRNYALNSIESRILGSDTSDRFCMPTSQGNDDDDNDEDGFLDFEPGTQLDVLINLCTEVGGGENSNGVVLHEPKASNDCLIECPLCGIDISDLSDEGRHAHTNNCLDMNETEKVIPNHGNPMPESPNLGLNVVTVLEWLQNLGLSKYKEIFVREEIDWDTLQWLTEEDLFNIGITTLGSRKKIVHARNELRTCNKQLDDGKDNAVSINSDNTPKAAGNKLITEYFPGSSAVRRNRDNVPQATGLGSGKGKSGADCNKVAGKRGMKNKRSGDIPLWCCIPGTPFRVDCFRYLRSDCSHWFLTHFHIDHYQGLTRSFCHGKIYCSLITARLVNTKIGIPWERLEVLPLNQKMRIEGVDIMCFDANHCPGAIIILFEPANGKTILHTGDFRFSEEMVNNSILKSSSIHTLILDTTYCNPQYDFPKQEAVIQFVIEAIQAESFNPKTLFLIGSYTIGKERLYLEVARCLRRKVYVGAAKLHLLSCLGFPEEDMQWFTLNEHESNIHVVPMWTIASFKRMKHISNQYMGRFNLIVAFSPTGWTFGKGKKKSPHSPGRRWKQGTIIRYEVPYSEHCSFAELKEFVQFMSPLNIIPSVNNDSPESADSMVALLTS